MITTLSLLHSPRLVWTDIRMIVKGDITTAPDEQMPFRHDGRDLRSCPDLTDA
jgi:hypothetical protein